MQPIKSYRIELGEIQKTTIYLVGAGGTGSFAALHLARLAWVAKQKRLDLRLIFIDPDVVEIGNVGRQNFCPSEVGQPKAVALAKRYSYAFGLQIESRVAEFRAGMVDGNFGGLALVIGCVDNPAARREMAKVTYHKRIWWLDSGNWLDGGNVFIGNSTRTLIDPTGFAAEVPRPDVQEPSLLDNEPAPATEAPASCADLLAQEVQSLMINQAMAGWVSVYAYRLILARDLDIQATYVNLAAGSVRSLAITGEAGRIERVKVDGPVRRAFTEIMRGNEPAGLITGADWDATELLEIQGGMCPGCGGRVTRGRDDVDEQETDIIFCPNCHWVMTVEDLEVAIEDAAETEEYQETMDRLMGPVVEEEEELEGVL